MARKPKGSDCLITARNLLRRAKSADELRTAQAVVLPLDMGFSLELTAKVIGRSVRIVSKIRTNYLRSGSVSCQAPRNKQLLRNRAHTTLEREAQILDEISRKAIWDGAAVQPIKMEIEEKLGKPIALSTLYRMLARNGWKKANPQSAQPSKNTALSGLAKGKSVWYKP